MILKKIILRYLKINNQSFKKISNSNNLYFIDLYKTNFGIFTYYILKDFRTEHLILNTDSYYLRVAATDSNKVNWYESYGYCVLQYVTNDEIIKKLNKLHDEKYKINADYKTDAEFIDLKQDLQKHNYFKDILLDFKHLWKIL